MRRSAAAVTFGSLAMTAVIAFEAGVGVARRQAWDAGRTAADLSAGWEAYAHREATESRLGLRVVGAVEPFSELTPAGAYAGRAVDRPAFVALLPALLAELDRYPVSTVSRFGLRRVVICTDLTLAGRPFGGASDFATGTLYLAAADADGGAAMFRHVIHHELFHLIDHAAGTLSQPDPAWTALNPSGFTYSTGGFNQRPGTSSTDLTSATTGFLTAYAKAAIEEDKAEVYGWLMADPDAIRGRAAKDTAIGGKTERMRQIVTGFDAAMDDVVPRIGPAVGAARS